ncbi:MAG: FKBP-type peptidyl-prolyl cis-trans isomerase [Oscillospiraceae bacterium]
MGDEVTLDFDGSVDGVPFDGGKAENYPLLLGSGMFIDGFEEQVAGIRPEEEREIHVTFPSSTPRSWRGRRRCSG